MNFAGDARTDLESESLAHAAWVIRSGGVVAYPTEACFGLGCCPRNAVAIRRILCMKRRARTKGLILLADCQSRLSPYVQSWAVGCRQQMMDSWPGPHTWLLPARPRASCWLRGQHCTVAVRVTAHRAAAKLCRWARTPIVSTSANRAGRPMLRNEFAVLQEFGTEIDFIMPGRIGAAAAPSRIRHGETGHIVRG